MRPTMDGKPPETMSIEDEAIEDVWRVMAELSPLGSDDVPLVEAALRRVALAGRL